MIEWLNLASNSLWIFGLALALAAFSYASWQASSNHEKSVRNKFRLVLSSPSVHLALNMAGMLFCAGLAATSTTIFEIVLWIILAIAFGIWVILSGMQWNNLAHKAEQDDQTETSQH